MIIGDRVAGGKPGTEDYDTGTILSIDGGGYVTVAWESGSRTSELADDLTPLPPAPRRGANLAVNEGTPHV